MDHIRTDLGATALIDEAEAMTDDDVRAAVAVANIPVLLMIVFQMTGDEKWLELPYRPTRGRGLEDHDSGGLRGDVQAEVRAAAVDSILAMRSGERPVVAVPSHDLMTRMLTVFFGEPVAPGYGEMLGTELENRLMKGSWRESKQKPALKHSFIVIGAGVAGIIAATELSRRGADFVVLERQPEAGGNWLENLYPGAGVDTPSHLYSFSFAPRDWDKHFELRTGIQDYLETVVDAQGIRGRVRFGVSVESVTYLADTKTWELKVMDALGGAQTLHADVVISAVGVLNRPKIPALPGLDTFEGPSFHTSRWQVGTELKGKRVAVIGTGASSMQTCPAIAGEVGQLTIFQRTPQWVAPFPKFQQPILPELRQLLRSVDLYRTWYWIRLFWQFGDKVIEALRVDPDWPHPERSVNARNDGHRQYFTRYIQTELEGRDDLIAKTIPDYPPYGKRILLDNGWYSTLRRDNVELVTEAVTAVTPHSVIDESGNEREFDVLVWATGFEATRFLSSFEVYGVNGGRLRDVWEDDNPRAYLGVSVPGFPNFFMLGGPNSFPGSGSFMFFIEVQMRYLMSLWSEMQQKDVTAVDATDEANDQYNELVDDMHSKTVWTHPGMSTYYRNSRGRVVFVMPFLNLEYWQMTKQPSLDDYTIR